MARSQAPPGFLTVGRTARIVGVSPSTLRLWENVGLISPIRGRGDAVLLWINTPPTF